MVDLEQLFLEYYDKVFIYIARRINNVHDAEEVTAEIFMKAFAYPFDPRTDKFSAYIYTIAVNVLKEYNHATGMQKRSTIEPEKDLGDINDTLGDLIQSEEYDVLNQAMASLSEKEYEVLYHRYYLEESFSTIGAKLGLKEVYTRKIHQRALGALNAYIDKSHVFDTPTRKQA
ncbi:MAG: RNA polymerase sigma factor [Clostridium sp.]|jgi:RNA polymerase sigma-70 factor (ECF subfamily)|nr:RNA polymerase sigma factor [Clostridium sp.]